MSELVRVYNRSGGSFFCLKKDVKIYLDKGYKTEQPKKDDEKQDLDLNKDGVEDEKDVSKAGKLLADVKNGKVSFKIKK